MEHVNTFPSPQHDPGYFQMFNTMVFPSPLAWVSQSKLNQYTSTLDKIHAEKFLASKHMKLLFGIRRKSVSAILQLKEYLQQERKGFVKSDVLWDCLGNWGNSFNLSE